VTGVDLLAAAQSWLFVPGDRPERFSKAVGSGADVVILDLEDAVAPKAKPAARSHIVAWLNGGGRAVVRVNAAASQWFDDDLAALAGAPGLLAVLLPKAESAEVVSEAVIRAGVPVVALVESARGVLHAADIATAAIRLAFGSLDFALDIAADHDDDGALLLARSTLVLASRAAGLAAPIDGVTIALDDPAVTSRAALRSRQLGFGGKLCIHPSQVASVQAAFRPSPEQVAWAREIIAAYGDGAVGAVRSTRGELIDVPVLRQAHAILERSAS
jgi:citrate lyase subunit beta/citryl-CoA lyase